MTRAVMMLRQAGKAAAGLVPAGLVAGLGVPALAALVFLAVCALAVACWVIGDPVSARPASAPVPLRAAVGRRARLPLPAAARQAKALARGRLRAVAVDGKTSRGARRSDGTRVHLLGVAEHSGHLLDHLEVGVKHNETSHFTELLEPVDLDGAVVTFDALHTVRANLNRLVKDKKAHYIAVVKQNQPLLHARIKALPWRQVPAASTARDTGHGRIETRTLKAAHVSRLDFPGSRQAIKITRRRQDAVTCTARILDWLADLCFLRHA